MALVTLRVIDGADRGKVFENLPTPISIGREEGNTVQLNDERVSRFHLKIQEDQDKLVLTDLESTNGTKINGEDVQLRILRVGDMVTIGRTILLVGSREQIARRLAMLRGGPPADTGTVMPDPDDEAELEASFEFEIGWTDDPEARSTFQALQPPELPERLSPLQAAQLCELLEYLHIRIRDLLNTVKMEGQPRRAMLEEPQWQGLLDLQARLATYLRSIGEPTED